MAVMVLVVGLAGALATSACGGSKQDPATATAPHPTTIERSTIRSIDELQRGLEAKGIPCKLEYEGLRQEGKTLSICIIDGSQATLTIWDEPAVLQKFLTSDVSGAGATAVGANWTVDVDSAQTAGKIAAALGGTVKTADPTRATGS